MFPTSTPTVDITSISRSNGNVIIKGTYSDVPNDLEIWVCDYGNNQYYVAKEPTSKETTSGQWESTLSWLIYDDYN